jgi:NitT/TauT family transport system permease protein
MTDSAFDIPYEDESVGRRRFGGRLLAHLLIFAVILAVWEAASRLGLADELTFPRPSAIAESLVRIFFVQGNIWWHLYVTLAEAAVGYVIGCSIGVGLAVLAAMSEAFRHYIKPYIVLVQVTPRVAIAPLMIAALGFGWAPKFAVVALICFFAPFVNTLTGLLTPDEDAHEMFRSLGASKAQIFRKLMVPNAMPIIMAGLKVAAASALAGAIVGEYVSPNQGVGTLISRYTFALNMPSSFACLLTLTGLGFLFFKAIEFVDSRVIFWRDDARLTLRSRRRAAEWTKSSGAAS